MANEATWPGRLQWHGDIHRQWGGRSLHFWFLRLPEMYDPAKRFAELVACMKEVDAVAYAGYELTGEFDVLIRAWLPPSEVGQFAELLEKRLRPRIDRNYAVLKTHRHWVWQAEGAESDGDIARAPKCDIETLAAQTTVEDVATLNTLSDVSHREDIVKTRNTKEKDLLKRFLDAHAVTLMAPNDGIRLIIRLRPDPDIHSDDLRKMTINVAKELDRMREVGDPSPASVSSRLKIRDLSMYSCADGTIIILCRIRHKAWHLIRNQLLTPLAAHAGVAQTTTHPALSRNLEISRERLALTAGVEELLRPSVRSRKIASKVPSRLRPSSLKVAQLPDPPPDPVAVHEFFDREESETFEAKGSAFTPLDDWLGRDVDASEGANLQEEKAFFSSTIAKTVVAMLNTEGGVILIGVLEASRYDNHESERVRLRVAPLPRAGRFRLLGLQDPIYTNRGWDLFDRKFHALLKGAIDGNSARRVHLYPGWHNGRWFALVVVEPARGMRRFYLKDGDNPKFLIRLGGSSEELKGTQIDDYFEDDGTWAVAEVKPTSSMPKMASW